MSDGDSDRGTVARSGRGARTTLGAPALALLLACAACAPPPGTTRDAATGGGDASTRQARGATAVPATRMSDATDRSDPAPDERTAPVLATELRAVDARMPVGAPLELRFVARNDTDETLELLIWNTPLEEPLSADLFAVERDGERLPYRGRLIKRGQPEVDDLVRLAPGQAVERTVDIARYYAVDRPGRYTIAFAPRPSPLDARGVRLGAPDEPVVVERAAAEPDAAGTVERASDAPGELADPDAGGPADEDPSGTNAND